MNTTWKEHQIVTTKTEKLSPLYSFQSFLNQREMTYSQAYGSGTVVHNNRQHIHAHVLSDDEIRVGDWYLSQTFPNSKIDKYEGQQPCEFKGTDEDIALLKEFTCVTYKIICSTDPNLYSLDSIEYIPHELMYNWVRQHSYTVMVGYVVQLSSGIIMPDVIFDKDVDVYKYRLLPLIKDGEISIKLPEPIIEDEEEYTKKHIFDKLEEYWSLTHGAGHKNNKMLHWLSNNL